MSAGPPKTRRVWELPKSLATQHVALRGDGIILTAPLSRPSVTRLSLAETFHAPYRLWIYDVEVLTEIVRAVAERLSPETVETAIDRLRLRWWAHYDGARVRSRRFEPAAGGAPLTVDDLAVWGPPPPENGARRAFWLPDEIFFYGPATPGLSMSACDVLRETLFGGLDAGCGVALSDGFPRIDHDAVEPGEWVWDPSDRGESTATLRGGVLTTGYQYGHDMGWSSFPVERALTEPPGVHFHYPASVRAEVRARLTAAQRPHP